MSGVMQYVVAVSGGVDSVVLLDMLAKGKLLHGILIVAHFDHGIRNDSAEDAEFVGELAKKYGFDFETKREELGADASEELARERRYAFLREVAKERDAKIVTAHHADDVVETIAINMTRGTGWRGLAVLNSPDIERPLLDMKKSEIIEYAKRNGLQWREDSTNADMKYLRNDLRQKLVKLDEDSREALRLYRKRQVVLKRLIEEESERIIGKSPYSRYLFINAPVPEAEEMLRAALGFSPTRPQVSRALLAIKVLQAGKVYQVALGVSLKFTTTHFVVDRG